MTTKINIHKNIIAQARGENLSPSKEHSQEVQDLAFLMRKVKELRKNIPAPLSPQSPNTPEKREREYQETPVSDEKKAKKGLIFEENTF